MPTSADAQRQPLLPKKPDSKFNGNGNSNGNGNGNGNGAGKPILKPVKRATGKPTSTSNMRDYPITVHPYPRATSNSSSDSDEESLYIKDKDDLDSYFEGPLPLGDYSRFPYFMRLRGSILPKMVVPLVLIGLWSTAVVHLIKRKPEYAVSNLLMNTLGFVVALALSFRSSTAYERYGDGRRAWSRLGNQARNLARLIWLHSSEREGELGKEDLLSKITAVNLILAFAVSLKHRLRFEPHTQYEDMKDLIHHIHTFAHEAFDEDINCHSPKGAAKVFGEYLGLAFAQSDPREALHKSKKPLGNLPLEILNHLSVWTQTTMENGNLKMPMVAGSLMSGISDLTDIMGEAERVLNTPLPIAYNIAFSQITNIYVYTLPFQLYTSLHWLTVPGTILAAYIILGIASIGNSIENPFGHDNNDLNLDSYCEDLAAELDMITSSPPPRMRDFVSRNENLVLGPISSKGYAEWMGRSREDIWEALRAKSLLSGRKTVKEEMRRRNKKRVYGRELTR